MNIAEAIIIGTSHHSFHGIDSDFPERRLKYGSNNIANTSAMANERKLNNVDSVRNCLIRLYLSEPMTFLNPTSLARLADLAVDRLIKLMHAMISMKHAIAPNNHTNRMSPLDRLS